MRTRARDLSRRGKLAPRPQPGSPIIQHEHAHDPHHAQPPQQTNPPVHAQVQKQRPREQDTAARHGRAEEVVAREQGGGVLRVGERHVDEDALEDDEAGGAVEDDADDGGDPGDGGAGGPGEDEEADGGEEGAEEGGDEAVFLGAEAVGEDVGDEVEAEVEDVG